MVVGFSFSLGSYIEALAGAQGCQQRQVSKEINGNTGEKGVMRGAWLGACSSLFIGLGYFSSGR